MDSYFVMYRWSETFIL